jgi:hypothetical protein
MTFPLEGSQTFDLLIQNMELCLAIGEVACFISLPGTRDCYLVILTSIESPRDIDFDHHVGINS